ncbi:F0F1 ATP synthase subunit epsilon [Croceimicrobium sp.]|uniref:F0F1 ATP synthase subunit epsilon n=1 Tax=Croceimicrobium sp. TaxID=2828340 RepID=UPI003BAA61F8
MTLEIITPESKIFEGEADAVRLPGKEGLFQILNGHAPMISTLRAGEVKIDIPTSSKTIDGLHGTIETDKSNDKVLRMQVKGGVVEVQKDRVILLAD